MRTQSYLIVAAAGASLILAPTMSAHATDAQVGILQDTSVNAFFHDEGLCGFTEVALYATQQTTKSATQAPLAGMTIMNASVLTVDNCAGTSSFESGSTEDVTMVAGGASRIVLEGEVVVTDWADGSSRPLYVSVEGQMTDSPDQLGSHSNVTFVWGDGVARSVSQLNGLASAAAWTGSVVTEDGTDLIGDLGGVGQIGTFHQTGLLLIP